MPKLNKYSLKIKQGIEPGKKHVVALKKRVPAFMISENGSQLVGTEQELQVMIEGLDTEKLKEIFAERLWQWQFTTTTVPHQNGCAESLVKCCKISLKKEDHTLDTEKLKEIFAERLWQWQFTTTTSHNHIPEEFIRPDINVSKPKAIQSRTSFLKNHEKALEEALLT
ncbi:hypothetical protein ACROYT_G015108 [Oculina patagonica]